MTKPESPRMQADAHHQALSGLSSRLEAAGYDEASVLKLLHLKTVLAIDRDRLPGLILRCRSADSPLAHLTAFWLLEQPLPPPQLEALLSPALVEALTDLELIVLRDSKLWAQVALYSCLGCHFFADPVLDHEASPTLPPPPKATPWLTRPGYALALSTPRAPGGRTLDVGGLTGVNAILQARHSEQAWGVVGSQALKICRINAQVNGVGGRCRFVAEESELPEGDFDLITSLAVAPASDQDMPLLRDLSARLAPGGILAVGVTHYTPDLPLLDRVESWLGGSAGWGLAQLSYDWAYLGHKPAPVFPLEPWPVDERFEAEADALLFIRRLAPGQPVWRVEATMKPPWEDISAMVAGWLGAQSLGDPDWEQWQPRWSYTGRLWVDPGTGTSLVRYHNGWFIGATALDQKDTFLLKEIDGQRRAGELLQAYAERWGEGLEAARADVASRLTGLCQRVMVE